MPESHFNHLKEVRLTPIEKAELRGRLRAYAITNSVEAALPSSAWSWRTLRNGAFAVSVVAFVVAGGTSVSAQWAHPGDTLYSFRLSVNDRIETALAVGDDAQVDVEMNQLQRMIDDEDAFRDDALSPLAFEEAADAHAEAPNDIDTEMTSIERELQAATDDLSENPAPRSTPETLDTGDFDRELRSIERELREEDRSRLELEL